MLKDVFAVLWKEWRLTTRPRGARSGLSSWVILVGLTGILMPLQAGAAWVSHPQVPLLWAWPPILATMWMMSDSFAGERERHTLEVLLSTPLSDEAILAGKILAGIIYGWSIEVSSLFLAAATVNLRWPHSGFYSWPWFLTLLGLSLLVVSVTCSAGALMSLHALTVRCAYQRLNLVILGLGLMTAFALRLAPAEIRGQLAASFTNPQAHPMPICVLVLSLIVSSVILIAFTLAQFQRNRLVLD